MSNELTLKDFFNPVFDIFNKTIKDIDKLFAKELGNIDKDVKINENTDNIEIKANIKGFKKEDIVIDVLKNNYISIAAKDENKKTSYISSLPASVTIKDAEAEYKDNTLVIKLKKINKDTRVLIK